MPAVQVFFRISSDSCSGKNVHASFVLLFHVGNKPLGLTCLHLVATQFRSCEIHYGTLNSMMILRFIVHSTILLDSDRMRTVQLLNFLFYSLRVLVTSFRSWSQDFRRFPKSSEVDPKTAKSCEVDTKTVRVQPESVVHKTSYTNIKPDAFLDLLVWRNVKYWLGLCSSFFALGFSIVSSLAQHRIPGCAPLVNWDDRLPSEIFPKYEKFF